MVLKRCLSCTLNFFYWQISLINFDYSHSITWGQGIVDLCQTLHTLQILAWLLAFYNSFNTFLGEKIVLIYAELAQLGITTFDLNNQKFEDNLVDMKDEIQFANIFKTFV